LFKTGGVMETELKTEYYKAVQKRHKTRFCTVPGKTKDNVHYNSEGKIYKPERTGIRLVGVVQGDKFVPVIREPKNKKERRKAALGLPYMDKKGNFKADEGICSPQI